MRVILMTLIAAVVTVTAAVAAEEKPRCDKCGMFFERSPIQVAALVTVDGEEVSHLFEGLGCFYGYLNENYSEEESVEVEELTVLDYNTFGTKKLTMLDASAAHYLYGTAPLKGSMAPFIAAFASADAAEAALADLGGEAVDFKEMMTRLSGEDMSGGCGCAGCGSGAADTGAIEYVCPMGCDKSDQPGTCAKCGMNLIEFEG